VWGFVTGVIGQAKTDNLYAIVTTVVTLVALFKSCAGPYIDGGIDGGLCGGG